MPKAKLTQLRIGAENAGDRPVAVDLFAGGGGLSLGLEQAGFDVAAAVEYDPVHAATHEFNFPLTRVLCADVSAPLRAAELRQAVSDGLSAHGRSDEDWDGEIDLVAGGPPCQGFSLIGKRLVDDSRNQLVFHFFRLVSELKPRYFVMENVPGMTRGGHAGILDTLIQEFESIGYRFPEARKYRVLNAADFGVPQDRKRLFLIGTRADQEAVATHPEPKVRPVPKRESMPRRGDASLAPGPSVSDAIGDLPNLDDFSALKHGDEVEIDKATLRESENAMSDYARRLHGLAADPEDLGYERVWNPSRLTASARTEHTSKSIARFEVTVPGETEPISRFYRLDPKGLCNTLRAGSGSERGAFTSPRPLHPVHPRVLSVREAARLHSFPDWFRPHGTKWHGFRQIGNAVAPLVGRAVGQQVIAALGASPTKPDALIELGDPHLLELTMSQATDRFGVDEGAIPAKRTRGAIAGDSNRARDPAEREPLAA